MTNTINKNTLCYFSTITKILTKNKIIVDKYYDRLVEIQKEFPKLTFQNDGYEYLSKKVQEDHKNQIIEITEILKKTVKGFSEFNNFKLRNNGDIVLRLQYNYKSQDENNKSGISFIGVGYFNINDFKNFEENGK